MGSCCASSSDEASSRLVDREIDGDKRADKEVKKLLLLGAGSSGKTTIFKQLKFIYLEGFSDKDKMDYAAQIENQIIENMQKIIMSGKEMQEEYPGRYDHLSLGPEAIDSAAFLEDLRRDSSIDSDVAHHVQVLWDDRGIRATFDMRAKLTIPDSCEHFFDSIKRISEDDYIPTNKDILLVRKRTTGIIEEHFTIKGTRFHIFDVGGQRNERKKWIHCFENVTAVVFVASLSCYDETLLEDDNVIVMDETLSLFEEICNSRWFSKTSFILFLNKRDLFEIKIKNVPLTSCNSFADYMGTQSYASAIEYIKGIFESKNHSPDNKRIYTHITCATDKDNVQRVFNDVQHIVINASLTKGGLI